MGPRLGSPLWRRGGHRMFAVLACLFAKGNLFGRSALQSLLGQALIPFPKSAYTSSTDPSQYTSSMSGADELYRNSATTGAQSMVYRAPYMTAAANKFCQTVSSSCP